MVQTEISSDAMPMFFDTVEKIAKDLREKDVTQDELDRAVRPAKENLKRGMQTNQYWASVLMGIQLEPRRVEDLRRQASVYDKVTPASVRKSAQTWLVPAKAWKTTVVPDAAAVAAK
jgi:zinc protease